MQACRGRAPVLSHRLASVWHSFFESAFLKNFSPIREDVKVLCFPPLFQWRRDGGKSERSDVSAVHSEGVFSAVTTVGLRLSPSPSCPSRVSACLRPSNGCVSH